MLPQENRAGAPADTAEAPEPKLSAKKRERIERLMAAVKAELKTMLAEPEGEGA